jgi:hypothetical protein
VRAASCWALLLAGCFDWQRAESICLDAGGACTRAGNTPVSLTFGDGGAPLQLGSVELGVPLTVPLYNAGPGDVSGLTLTIAAPSPPFGVAVACSVIDAGAGCPVTITPLALGYGEAVDLHATWSGGSAPFGVRGDAYARLRLATSLDGGGAWLSADGGLVVALDGGPCGDDCDIREFTAAPSFQVQPSAGCFATADQCNAACPVTTTLTASGQLLGFDETCLDLAFVTDSALPITGGLSGWGFTQCAVAARDAGFPFADEYQPLVFGLPLDGGDFIRPDGVFYTGPASMNSVFIDEHGYSFNRSVWRGDTTANCAGWTDSSPQQFATTVDPVSVWPDSGFSYDCSNALSLQCFGRHWRAIAPPARAPPDARFAFVSVGAFAPDSGIAVADSLCQAEAADAGLRAASQFVAFLSQGTSLPATRLQLDGGNWYRIDNLPLLLGPGDLRSFPPLFRVALGKTAWNTVPANPDPRVWVGDNTSDCAGWTGAGQGTTGDFNVAGETAAANQFWPCSEAHPVYCFEN